MCSAVVRPRADEPAATDAGGTTTTTVRSELHLALAAEELAADLHPTLREQIESVLEHPGSSPLDLRAVLRAVSSHYEQIDEERRGMVRSMQLMSDEARRWSRELSEQNSGHLQVILDHIKDVVITVDADGGIQTFNPTGEQVFGYSQAEMIGRRIDTLLPQIAGPDGVAQGLRHLARHRGTASDLSARDMTARRKSGETFPAEVAVSAARLRRRDVFVVCLRDATERHVAEQALRESEARYRTLVDNAPEAIVVYDLDARRFVDVNENAAQLFRMSREELLALSPADISPEIQVDGRSSRGLVRGLMDAVLAGRSQFFEWIHRDGEGHEFPCEVRLVRLPSANRCLVRGSITDISERKRGELITSGEREVFALLANNAPLPAVLESITRLIESVSRSALCSISVLAADGASFQYLVAPHLPERLHAVLDRSQIDIRFGSCAAAVYLGRQVLVPDVARDPFWQLRREEVLEAGLHATWSTPIKSAGGRMLGSLCVYARRPGLPSADELALIAHAVQLAGIAIERRFSEEALRSSEAKFRGLFQSVMEGVFQSTLDGRLLSVNPAFVGMLGYVSAEELYALPSAAMLYWNPADRADLARRIERDGEIRNAEFSMRRRDGQQIVVLESSRVTRDESGRVTGFEGTIVDITERKRADQAVLAEKERAQVTLQSIGDAVISTDARGLIEYLNPVAERLTGWSGTEARGRPLGQVLTLVDEVSRAPIEDPLAPSQHEGATVDRKVLVDRHGLEIAIQDSVSPIRDRQGRAIGAVVVFYDVTKERRLRRALSYQASHDALTGLINRREFDNRLQAAVQSARSGTAQYALLYVDLDQFKLVNDTCGHQAGDRLIRDVTALLQPRVRASDTIARLGGDEFGILLANCTREHAESVAESVRQAIREFRFVWGSSSLSIGASIGVVAIDRDTESVTAALSAADIACYAAKEEGRNRVHVYDASGGSDRHREMQWVARVTHAAEEDRFELLFQPIVAIAAEEGAPAFHEITVRMRDSEGNVVPPGEFIPAAERYNAMVIVDRWVVRETVRLLRGCADSARRPLLAVNLSGSSLNDQGFLDFVLGQIAEGDIGRSLCFEITETAAVASLANAVYFMRELRARGCRFALDDFGSGLSSFMYLKTLPVDFLKIDGQFVANIATDTVDRSMVEAICQIGRALGIGIIAERVETGVVLEELGRIGLDFAQGFHLARPRPIAELGITPPEHVD
ncbi:MAG: PAS domain S-box protein [Gammaproteobacteria bacterium]|nr:PAS domain S-box protein [Gammaproteobacteria bacterium]